MVEQLQLEAKSKSLFDLLRKVPSQLCRLLLRQEVLNLEHFYTNEDLKRKKLIFFFNLFNYSLIYGNLGHPG